jgi:argininosuccinate lyase
VRRAAEKGVDLVQLGVDELKQFSKLIDADVVEKLSLEGSLAARDHIGGTAPKQVRAAIARARRQLAGR